MTIEQEFFEAFNISKIYKRDYLGIGESQLRYIYPPITPEIVLGLIEILNKEYNILIIECMSNSTKITACPAPEQDWGCDEAYYRVTVEENDLRTAILKVCSNYNVAMSIQSEVRELFNER